MSGLTIIDGHNWLFRAFYGVPPMAQTKEGVQINAVYGFFSSLRHVVSQYPTNKLFVVFDSETGIDDKLQIKSSYKANRDTDTTVFDQLPYVKQILDWMNVKWIEHPRYEADDVIASLTTYWAKNHGRVYISSNDFDFMQLVGERKVSVLRSGGGQITRCDWHFVQEKFNVLPYQFVDYKSLVGDQSDNIAGVFGVGKQTAAELLNRYGNIDGIYEDIDSLSPALRQRMLDAKNAVYANRKFIAMNCDIPHTEIITDTVPKTNRSRVYKNINFYIHQIGLK